MSGELGKANYELDVDLNPLRRGMQEGRHEVDQMERTLDALTAISKVAEEALNQVRMAPGQGAESRATAEAIISGVRGISDEARTAARELDRVKLTDAQAAESGAAGELIKHNVKDIGDEADRTKRKLTEVKLAGGRSGVGVGIFGSGFGRIGLLGTAIGAGVLTAPAAGPGALGLLAAVPVLAGTAGGALGTLALAFDNVGKAIGGDKKAFDSLTPSAQKFTLTVRSLDGWFDKLKETAASSLFPGLTKGLKEALSPGTLAAITVAVTALGHALGAAGIEWGHYFGSPEFQQIFGPLMQSAAHTIRDTSSAALSLFDALGVLARAAIPLTSWLTGAAASGAKLVDTWLRAKDATGQLGGAMSEAKTSLQLVGGLISALLRAIGALGEALYPVAKVAVKDLTGGLNALAGIIDRNKGEIRDIVGGALNALVGAVKIAYPLVAALAQALTDVAHAVGGWKVAFAIVLTGALAKSLYGVALQFAGVSTEAAAAMTWSARLAAVLDGLRKIGPIIIAVGIDYFVNKYGAKNAINAVNPTATLGPDVAKDQTITVGGKSYPIGTSDAINALRKAGYKGPLNSAIDEITAAHSLGGSSSLSKADVRKNINDATDSVSDMIKRALSSVPNPPAAGATGSPFGAQPPFTKNLGPKGSQPGGANLLSEALRNALQKAKDMATQTQGATAAHWLQVELDDLQKARKQLESELRGSTGKKRAAIQQELRSIDGQIASVNKQITTNLHEQAQAIKTSFASKISAAKSTVTAAASIVKQTLDAQLQQQLQNYLDAALGPRYYQGVDPTTGAPRQTPLEQQLADMQAADRKQQLQDALSTAQHQLELDRQNVDVTKDQLAADQQAVDQAQRAIDENDLAIRATAERQKADADYAAAVNKAQADYQEKQRQLNLQIDQWTKGVEAGTQSIGDLQAITDSFGLSLTADGGIVDDFNTLQTAVQALAKVIADSAAALAKVGDKKDAAAAQALADTIGYGTPVKPGQGSVTSGLGGALGFFKLNPISMADGGIGRATLPTLFFSRGDEDFAFSGEGRSFASVSSQPVQVVVEGFVGNEAELAIQIGRVLQRANGRGIKFGIA